MEHNGLQDGMYTGMLGLEMPLQQQNPPNPQNPPHQVHHPHPHHHHHPSNQMLPYPYPSYTSSKTKQHSSLSDEEDPCFGVDDANNDGKGKNSPWQRMKWTDSMVRLLIVAVYHIGDEAGSEAANDPSTGKKKAGAVAGAGAGSGSGSGLSPKKGKWKSVSRAMMEKGFFVSPQQCEDKFNDLNKRYKRVNDILGKGTACRVVENQRLLDTMDLSPKMKEEVKKLLNSKHLFFREMCAYHNSCGNGSTGVASNANRSPEVATTDQSQVQNQQATATGQQQQQRCSHSSETAQFVNSRAQTDGLKLGAKRGSIEDDDDDDDDDDESDDQDEDDDDEDDGMEGHSRGQNGSHRHDDDDDHDDNDNDHLRKRPRRDLLSLSSSLMQQLNSELLTVIQDGAKSSREKKQWMKLRLMQLEEQQVSYQLQAFEMEKQRLKWVKFSGKKEREMERAKLENERRRLENERMVLLVRQKELELLDLQHQKQQLSSNKRGDPSSLTS